MFQKIQASSAGTQYPNGFCFNHKFKNFWEICMNQTVDIYQTWCSRGCSINSFVIYSLIRWSFCSESSKHCPEELGSWNFERIFTPPLCVTCHISCVMCHVLGVRCQVSRVRCHVSGVTYYTKKNIIFYFLFLFFFVKVVELVGWRSVINGAYPV